MTCLRRAEPALRGRLWACSLGASLEPRLAQRAERRVVAAECAGGRRVQRRELAREAAALELGGLTHTPQKRVHLHQVHGRAHLELVHLVLHLVHVALHGQHRALQHLAHLVHTLHAALVVALRQLQCLIKERGVKTCAERT